MNKILYLAGLLMLMPVFVFSQFSDQNYRIFDSEGNPATMEQIIDGAGKSDVVFLGEMHDDAVCHYLQAEIFKRVLEKYNAGRKIALSMEMFERDVQIVVDEYLADQINEANFIASSRAWGNYKTDYRPLIEMAKAKKIPVVAANAPRRYVNMVSRNGREAINGLSGEAKAWLAPLPFAPASEAYSKKFMALMGHSQSDAPNPMPQSKLLDSQSLWDATMAHSISRILKKQKNSLVVHLNGAFHSENRIGTPDHLLKYMPKAKFLVVTMRYEEDFSNFDKAKHRGLGDFVVLTDAKIPRSKR